MAGNFTDAVFNELYTVRGRGGVQCLGIGLVTDVLVSCVTHLLTRWQLIVNGTHSGYPNATSGGIVYMKYIWPVLTNNGQLELALRMMLGRGMPSIDYWIEGSGPNTGATTLWENWQSTNFQPFGRYAVTSPAPVTPSA